MIPLQIRDENDCVAIQLLFVGHSASLTITDKARERRPVTRCLSRESLLELSEAALQMHAEWGEIIERQERESGAA